MVDQIIPPVEFLPPIAAPSWLARDEYPFRRRAVRLRDGVVNLVDEGEGRPMLFVHGTPSWSFDMRHLLQAFRGRFRVLAPDHLGFGLSERPVAADYSPEAHAARFAELVDALDLRDLTLVVHDFGGPIALPWAAANPDRLRRIVYLNTFAGPVEGAADRFAAWLVGTGFGRWLYRVANLSLRVLMPGAYADRRHLTPAIHAHFLAPFADPEERGRVLHALARSLLGSEAFFCAVREKVKTVLTTIPSTLVWGLADPAFDRRALARLQAILPQARVVPLVGVGHWPQEESPRDVISALEST